jgi:hypothetical protein
MLDTAITRLIAAASIACAWSAQVSAQPHNSPAYSAGYAAGALRWAADHCNGSISAAHAKQLQIERTRDPATFDKASTSAYAETVELVAKSSLEFSGAGPSESARLGKNVACQVTEWSYGPHGVLWVGAWIPPAGRPTTAK